MRTTVAVSVSPVGANAGLTVAQGVTAGVLVGWRVAAASSGPDAPAGAVGCGVPRLPITARPRTTAAPTPAMRLADHRKPPDVVGPGTTCGGGTDATAAAVDAPE